MYLMVVHFGNCGQFQLKYELVDEQLFFTLAKHSVPKLTRVLERHKYI